MKLSDCISQLKYECRGNDVEVTSLEMDSRKVNPGALFFCIPGGNVDGHDFASDVQKKGASALIVDHWLDVSLPQVKVDDVREAMSLVAETFFDYPTEKLKMIAVTGTNGKTSTTYMVKTIAEACGKKVGLMGTIANYIGSEKIETDMTTPDPIALQSLLAQMVEANVDWVVMEASAHALYLRKLKGIRYDISIFSNLTEDHLDFFETMERYYQAKTLLFTNEMTDKSIINIDDDYGKRLFAETETTCVSYSAKQQADYQADNIISDVSGVRYDAVYNGQKYHVSVDIPGEFTVYNTMAAIAACIEMGLDPKQVIESIGVLHSVPGRCESLNTMGHGFGIILDYAHTPDAIENILTTVRRFTRNRLIILFGCGGNRDKKKRPIMGEMAARYADYCIVTSDNPRFEEPEDIIDDILPGVEAHTTPYKTIVDRIEAIRFGLDLAQDGDVLVLAGKGHETYQDVKGVKHHFDEKEIVQQLLSNMK